MQSWGETPGRRVDVGGALKAARIAQGLYVPEISYRTRLRAELIEAIERNDFSTCGGDVFARGHVRAIAAALGIDPAPFMEAMGGASAATGLEQAEPESLNIWQMRERAIVPSERRMWTVLAVVGMVIVAALVAYARAGADSAVLEPENLPSVATTGKATVVPEETPIETPAPEPTPSETPSTEVATSAPTPPQETAVTVIDGAIVLHLDCTQTSWVRITNDRGTLYEGTMRAGASKVLSSDTDVTVRIGNAAGMALTVNDTAYTSLGGPGVVYTHTFHVA